MKKKKKESKEKYATLQDSARGYIREISVAMILQIQTDVWIIYLCFLFNCTCVNIWFYCCTYICFYYIGSPISFIPNVHDTWWKFIIIIIISIITVFAGVLFVHQPGANHAPRASVTRVNHSVHTLRTFLRIFMSFIANVHDT